MTLELVTRAAARGNSTAVVDQNGSFSYSDLLSASDRLASMLLRGATDLEEARIAFLIEPGFSNVATQWSIWRAGGVAVPLGTMHPLPELEYVLDDTDATAVVAGPHHLENARNLADSRSIPLFAVGDEKDVAVRDLPDIAADRRAMILYTSGTTSRPKGVVTTHANIQAQVTSLISAWEWNCDDHILHVLPLHHVHGIINVLTCALWAGAKCEFLAPFDVRRVWERFGEASLSLFMAVPTIYGKLIKYWDETPADERRQWSAGCASMRLMVSGSAALPISTLKRWQEITGQVLLERYGMTEIGMALSNPLHGDRIPGHVGKPLPGVRIRRVDREGNELPPLTPGEIQVKGPNIFLEYWRRPGETSESFQDGWFRTGDVAIVSEAGAYRILGRSSVDIIKTGGYKVSALEIEEVLRTHPAINECAVVGIPNVEWGECVSACVVTARPGDLSLETLRSWAKDRLAVYKVPQHLLVVEDLPRNAMGKVQKPAIKDLFAGQIGDS